MKKIKIQYITRSIITSDITVVGLNTSDMSVTSKHVKLTGEYENNDKTLEIIKMLNTDKTFAPAMIRNIETCEKVYALSTDEFLKYAKEVPSRFKVN